MVTYSTLNTCIHIQCLSDYFASRNESQLNPDRSKEYFTQCFIASNLPTMCSTKFLAVYAH